ncbi:MAG: glycosyltransferase family 4 protein [Thermodesulfobacteriota bacterium]
MIHILLCPHRLDYGGSQLGLHHWARRLDGSRFRVTVLAMARGGLSEKFESCYEVLYDDVDYPGITDHIERLGPDIVHCGPPGGKDFDYIKRAARLAPVTQTVMCPRVVGNYDDVAASVVPSRFVLGLQGGRDRVVQIDHPFDPSDYDVRFGRGHFGLPEGRLIIGSLGNSRKENAHFLDIAGRYRNNDVHFVIKSDRTYRGLFGRKRITTINRMLTEDEKMSLIDCFDVFLYPTSNEAYGVVFLEAMSRKVPIITYDDSANREVVGAGGLFAPAGDIKAMTSLLDRLVADEAERRSLGEAGHALFAGRNDPERVARKYEALFESVLGQGRPPRPVDVRKGMEKA